MPSSYEIRKINITFFLQFKLFCVTLSETKDYKIDPKTLDIELKFLTQ